MGWDGETEREECRPLTKSSSLLQCVCDCPEFVFFSEKHPEDMSFRATVDVIYVISSQRCILKCDL